MRVIINLKTKKMNTYYKYAPNVFIAKCDAKHEKGEKIKVTTRYGKENDSIVFNFIGTSIDGNFFYYSIVRADGLDAQKWAEKKAEKLKNAAIKAENKSNEYWKASNKNSDFLSLGEPIKVGHHSEKRHRKIIEQANTNMGKCVEYSKKAENYEGKIEYWEVESKTINLSMPESLEFYKFKLEKAKVKHEGLKNGTIEREHSFSLAYAKKEVNEAEKKVKSANLLWG